ncbi:hypothetical protein ERO13_D02G165175v2 [Gossypium hirsutum]|nr:hypothetical protein ERO13_D02G165175v2 [Gossypium hirsutum]
MESSNQFKSQILHYSTNIFLNPFLESTISLSLLIVSSFPSPKINIQKPIICARRSTGRNWSDKSTKLSLKLISILASNIKILPQSLDLIVVVFFACCCVGIFVFFSCCCIRVFVGLGLKENEAMK